MSNYVSRPGRRAGLLGALILCLIVAPGGAASARAAATPPAGSPIRAAFPADSYTFGVGPTQPSNGYAYLVAKHENWTARVVGLPGSGYVRVAIPNNVGYEYIVKLLKAELQTLRVH